MLSFAEKFDEPMQSIRCLLNSSPAEFNDRSAGTAGAYMDQPCLSDQDRTTSPCCQSNDTNVVNDATKSMMHFIYHLKSYYSSIYLKY